jgi:hypothetical protein
MAAIVALSRRSAIPRLASGSICQADCTGPALLKIHAFLLNSCVIIIFLLFMLDCIDSLSFILTSIHYVVPIFGDILKIPI